MFTYTSSYVFHGAHSVSIMLRRSVRRCSLRCLWCISMCRSSLVQLTLSGILAFKFRFVCLRSRYAYNVSDKLMSSSKVGWRCWWQRTSSRVEPRSWGSRDRRGISTRNIRHPSSSHRLVHRTPADRARLS